MTDDPPGSRRPRRLAPLRWSVATAAFQIEGARHADGRGRSIWDDFVEMPGAVLDGSTAEPGPDSWHRWREDIALAVELGVDRYRFSLSWVRVRPEHGRPANRAALDRYSRMVDALLDAGVAPFVTLYHWDLPSVLEEHGGWLDRRTPFAFAEYVQTVVDALGDRVADWYTINEPVSTTLQGYAIGELAPARTLLFGALPTAHHQLLAHGLAQQVIRSAGSGRVGIVNNHTAVRPASARDEDLAAAEVYDLLHNRLFADPVLRGEYPDLSMLGVPDLPVEDGDLALISRPSDFYGVNYYNPTRVGAAAPDSPIPFEILPIEGAPTTGFGWPIDPQGLRAVLGQLADRYGDALPPIVIGENGASFPEPDHSSHTIHDAERIDYLARHLDAVEAARNDGLDIAEFTVWSLLDNFEWADGFTQRFGLVHVDHNTSLRTPKASYSWFRDRIAASRAQHEAGAGA
ncbi:GH1 family beta-glucosidase [Microbacterium sp. TNHR37B]|uniref:GH1 family beta-glucosidase n=1 Tax=Microbacterium sp. TNHR37B TaxID=1775956 RepID=UPI0007B30CAF|nr:GH1 family beta-glucosidase [Microbacterium sp. TNHR37B]KZE90971.1 Beta-glucosidase [Microbacterium sp. TNHR37B]